jgi:S-methylmethionine-dependent homocysteine/selenocysteine methylase
MKRFSERVSEDGRSEAPESGRVLRLDGGLSSQLEVSGAAPSGALWTAQVLIDDPAAVESAHLAFLEAGAELIITASYQLSRLNGHQAGLSRRQVDEALRDSVSVARAACRRHCDDGGSPALVAASIGPYGAVLADGSEFRGRYGVSVADLAGFHFQRLDVILAAEPDVIAVETMCDALEIEAIVRVLSQHPEIEAWVSFTCGPDALLRDGSLLVEAVAAVQSLAAVRAVGVNCTAPHDADEAIEAMGAIASVPLIAYPNAGRGWSAADHDWVGEPVWLDETRVSRWITHGVRGLGGCCGYDAEALAGVDRILSAVAGTERPYGNGTGEQR